ncbi:MAG TPA: aminopeptidase [Rhodanobacteraceae bacterium]
MAAGIACALAGCSTLGYYSHLAAGEAHVLMARQPISQVIANPATPATLRQRLALALKARAFASSHLDLPRNKSYTLYANLHRPYVMYDVFATPRLSLKPVTHCFPFAGCVAYQGYYQLKRAKARAAQLAAQGDDVYIGGVPAYSTLGHFADPILSTMNEWSTDTLIGTIFHELAHQKIYVKGDTVFNESYATFVQREGLRQWHVFRHLPPPETSTASRRERQFTELILATRTKLKAIYQSPLSRAQKLKDKHAAFAQLRQNYEHLRDTDWHGYTGYNHWFDTPINNAKLLPFGLYDTHVNAFARLFYDCHAKWPCFFTRVQALGKASAAERKAFLTAHVKTASG